MSAPGGAEFAAGRAAGVAEAVAFLLSRAAGVRGSWVDPRGAQAAADALTGAAHDLDCGCEDSTVEHLSRWLARRGPPQG